MTTLKIYLKKGNWKTQPWLFRIEQGRVDTTVNQRYASRESAKRGARRKIKAVPGHQPGEWFAPSGKRIEFLPWK